MIIALAGTAMAAPTAIKSILNKQEKKQVKNIAKNQVTSCAGSLGRACRHGQHGQHGRHRRRRRHADAVGGQALANIVVARSVEPGAQCDPTSTTPIVATWI